MELSTLAPVPEHEGEFIAPSPQESPAAAELYAADGPLYAIAAQQGEVRDQVGQISSRSPEFLAEHVSRDSPAAGRPPTRLQPSRRR